MNTTLINGIINGMSDWVRVLDLDDNIIFINKAMADDLDCFPVGVKCFKAIGKSFPCENCTSRKAVHQGQSFEKEEVIADRVFSVMSSPVKNENGEVTAVVEVLRDITDLKMLQQKVIDQNKKLQADLNLARKLQCSLLPKNLHNDNIRFSFVYTPCEALGGDFLDIFRIDSENIGVYIADVSGHGVSASMLTIFLRSSINKKTTSPAQALKELYENFNEDNFDQSQYISIFYAVINVKEKIIKYSNAGLNVPPILFGKGHFELLRLPGIPISNWVESPEYKETSLSLESGYKLFFYTDGIIEIMNSDKEMFGEERLLEHLLADNSTPSQPYSEITAISQTFARNTAPSQVLNEITEAACSFAGIFDIAEIPDDITMALLEIV